MKSSDHSEEYATMNIIMKAGIVILFLVVSIGHASAGVYSSEQAISQQQYELNKQQVIALVNKPEVQQKFSFLGVNAADAKIRVESMTNQELVAFNQQINDMPAGGIVGTIVTVLVVVAVLDLMGLTDVYPFIRPL
jgi:hypothetical protein